MVFVKVWEPLKPGRVLAMLIVPSADCEIDIDSFVVAAAMALCARTLPLLFEQDAPLLQ
jgi:hypothetical protein